MEIKCIYHSTCITALFFFHEFNQNRGKVYDVILRNPCDPTHFFNHLGVWHNIRKEDIIMTV